MDALVLAKLLVTPTLVVAATLAGRRFGQGVSGWFVAIPFTTGPILLFIALAEGYAFAADAAAGALIGLLVDAAFAVAWTRAVGPRRPTMLRFAAATAVFAAAAGVAALLPPPGRPAGALAMGAVALLSFRAALGLVPRATHAPRAGGAAAAWDLPARAAVSTTLVLALTAVAPYVGPQLAGIAATFPVYASTLAFFAERTDGPPGGAAVLRGLLAGLATPTMFCLVIALTLEWSGIAASFGLALAVALVSHAVALRVVRADARG